MKIHELVLNYKDKLNAICKSNGMDPTLFSQIMMLRLKGYNLTDSAKRAGVTRQTVHRYMKIIRDMEDWLQRELFIATILDNYDKYLIEESSAGAKHKILTDKYGRILGKTPTKEEGEDDE